MLQGVIFDLDGVIVDSHPVHKQAWKKFFCSLGKEISDKDLDFVLEGNKRDDILRHFLGELTEQQVKDYGARKESLFRHSAQELKTTDGLAGFFDQINRAQLPIALASSASRSRVKYMLDLLNLQHRFRVIITGDDVIKGKPDPMIFRLAANALFIPPKQILVCEDSVNGIEAARKLGMKCLAIAANGRGPILKAAGAERIVADFTEVRLADLLELFV
ncbi:MAG: HAD-superfamily hydrolase [Candidatus Angelobacter sp.]|jgi:HAD superfamily hydrolase (TIGR01509 family)|nr:HAD-superfamily hydrolase [Candidatus Angelobacter sp.]